MEPLFDSEYISASIKSQADLNEAFLRFPNLAKGYVQTALHWSDLRKWYENHWPLVYRFLDKDFINKFKTAKEHDARAWEFHLAAVLTDKGIVLKEKTWTYGPDFCIEIDSGKKIWIEAIVCDLGNVDPVPPTKLVLEPGRIYTFGGNIEDDHRPRALRITSAIATKYEKYKRYLSNIKSGVRDQDSLIIAINGQAIQHYADPSMLFKRAVFGQGPDVLVKIPGKEKLQGGYYKPIPTIIKKINGEEKEIPACFMEMEEFNMISAVIYCGKAVSTSWLNGYEPGDDFLFAYHSKAKNPIKEKAFKFGRGIYKDIQNQQIRDQEQK